MFECLLPRNSLPYIYRGDMIDVYKILHNKYDSNAVGLNLSLSNIVHTRSNSYKLDKHRSKYDLRKFFFSERVVELWNSQ